MTGNRQKLRAKQVVAQKSGRRKPEVRAQSNHSGESSFFWLRSLGNLSEADDSRETRSHQPELRHAYFRPLEYSLR